MVSLMFFLIHFFMVALNHFDLPFTFLKAAALFLSVIFV